MEAQIQRSLFEHDLDHKEYYINRHLSWLKFNQKVLEEAGNPSTPIMDRLKFLAITSSNLDEFFMVRVASLKDQVRAGITRPDSKTGMNAREQLTAISECTHELVRRQYRELNESLFPDLKNHGIQFLSAEDMDARQWDYAKTFFYDRIFPVLTPMAIDSSRPFPMLHNRTLNMAVTIEKAVQGKTCEMIAVVQVPSILPRFISLPTEGVTDHYILLEELIASHISSLFVGHKVTGIYPFRLIRNADLPLHEEGIEDLLEEIEKELIKREMGMAVRLEIDSGMSPSVKEFLRKSLELEESDIFAATGPLDLTFLMKFAAAEKYAYLAYEPIYPRPVKDFMEENDLFQAISRKDILIHTPYESFESVTRFIQLAAQDPNVLAIKQTLYRVSGDSAIVKALANAAENGKQVFVLVELKARFDEENNIVWARKLEESGCHVIYGFVGLKTHGKIAMVVRQEGESIKRYIHVGTGNYNDSTAKLYTDVSMFTARVDFGEDATMFFNYLSGYSTTPTLKQLVIAPSGLRQKFIDLIEREMNHSTPEQPGRIIAKMNSLTDKDIIKSLYRASRAGVKIDLIVRGICCLRPGIADLSENIRVISIIGRYLEHSRIYYFHNGGNEEIYLSSADWMTRNLDRRIEILFPVIEAELKDRIREMLAIQLMDNEKARELMPDGTYKKIKNDKPALESQMYFYDLARFPFLNWNKNN